MNSLDCEKIGYLLPLYIDGKINDSTAFAIEQHLSNCSDCFEKYISLKNISQKIKASFDNSLDYSPYNKNLKFFEDNISSYIDNELAKEDYYNFNKFISLNPDAKKELDKMLFFEEKLQESIKKNKQILNKDLSKSIVNEIKKENPNYVYNIYLKAAILTVLFVILTILVGYFAIPEHWQSFAIKTHFIH
ncbi:zf-HC2 domain-containing protein [bacterium]|nr:zf-HC2 domain-containing protein [bacterium]